jgi:hypothetical protein
VLDNGGHFGHSALVQGHQCLAASFALSLCLSACDADAPTGSIRADPSSADTVPIVVDDLTSWGGCGDVTLYALDEASDTLLIVSADVADRSTAEPTVVAGDLPQPGVTVTLVRGARLDKGLCEAMFEEPGAQIDSSVGAATGTVTFTVGPAGPVDAPLQACGTTTGSVEVQNLVMLDGSRVADLTISSDDVGCYAE